MRRRFLSMLLVLAMLLSMVPMGTFAEETQAEAAPAAQSSYGECCLDSVYTEVSAEEDGVQQTNVHVDYILNEDHPWACVVAAAYKNGKMQDAAFMFVGRDDSNTTVTLWIPKECQIRVFLLDGETYEPLCESYDINTAPTESVSDEGELGENIKWTYQDGVLRVISKNNEPTALEPEEGTVRDYPWEKYADQIYSVELYNISKIARAAFSEYRYLNVVELYGASTEIGDMAFYGCTRLERVAVFGTKIVSVGQQAFDGCSWLYNVEGLEYCEKIGKYAFMGCTQLNQDFTFHSLKDLSYGAFEGSGVTSVSLVNCTEITVIPQDTFKNCQNLYSVSLPSNVVMIDDWAFFNAHIGNIDGLEKVQTIGSWAFAGTSLEMDEVNLSKLESLGEYAFAGAKLRSIRIDGTVTEIPKGAFKASWINYVDLRESIEVICSEAFSESDIMGLFVTDSLRLVEANAFRDMGLEYLEGATYNLGDLVIEEEGNHTFWDAWMNYRWGPYDDNVYETEDLNAQETEEVEETEALEEPEEMEETQAPEEPKETEAAETTEATEITEATEETEAPEAEDTMTAEEAAADGYYLAPDGVTMTEEVTPEQMAAYSGNDQVRKGTHTVTFSGLIPGAHYALIVGSNPGLYNANLQYIDQGKSSAAGTLTFTYIPKTNDKAIAQLYGPNELTLESEKDYLMLHPGGSDDFALFSSYEGADIAPVDLDTYYDDETGRDGWVLWTKNGIPALYVYRVDSDMSYWEIRTEDRYLAEPETYYVTFAADNGLQKVTTKVRVDIAPEDMVVKEVNVGESVVTRNVFDEAPTEIPIFLKLGWEEQNVLATFSAEEGEEPEEQSNNNLYIESVEFDEYTSETVKKFFTISAKDDRTLLLGTNPEAVKASYDVKSLKSSYKSVGFNLKIKGQERTVYGEFVLNVKKDLPKIKVATVTLNPYYAAQSAVTFTGGNVEKIVGNVSCGNTAVAHHYHIDYTYEEWDEELGEYVTVDGSGHDEFYIDYTKTLKAANMNVKTQVLVSGCLVPVDVTIPVKLDVKAPALKVTGSNKWTIPSVGENSTYLDFTTTTKGVSLGQMTAEEEAQVVDKKGNVVPGYTAEAYSGYVKISTTADARPAGKQDLKVRFRVSPQGDHGPELDQAKWLEVPFTVTNQDPKVKLNISSVNINVDVNAAAYLVATVTGLTDYPENANWNYTVTGGGMKDAKACFELRQSVDFGDGIYQLELIPKIDGESFASDKAYNAAVNGTYTVNIGLGTKPTTKLTVKLSDKTPGVKLTAKGTVNPDNSDSYITIDAAMQNVGWLDRQGYKITLKGQEKEVDTLMFYYDGGFEKTLVTAVEGKTPEPGTYTLTVFYERGIQASVDFKVVQTKRTLKVTGKLNSFDMDSEVVLTPSFMKRDENGDLMWPEIVIKDAKGNEFPKVITWGIDGNGVVRISPLVKNGRYLPAGKYTVTLTYGEEAQFTGSFQVVEPKLTLKTKGTLDSLADGRVELFTSFAQYEMVAIDDYNSEWQSLNQRGTVTVENTKTKKALVEGQDFTVQRFREHLYLAPIVSAENPIPAGTYKVTLNYGTWNGKDVIQTVTVKATQTMLKAWAEKSSITLHPKATMAPVSIYADAPCVNPEVKWSLELCDKKGNPVTKGTNLIKFNLDQLTQQVFNEDDSFYYDSHCTVEVVGTGIIPAADTTLYLKLTPDTRVPKNYKLLTVKVLGKKSVANAAKLTLATKQTLDPSHEYQTVTLTGALKSFDLEDAAMRGNLQVSTDNGKTYTNVTVGTTVVPNYDRNTKALSATVNTDEPILAKAKYRVVLNVYGDRTCETLIGTATTALKVAYGTNRFTVEKAPTLYKADAGAEMTLKLNAKDPLQKIDHITVKGRNDFAVYENVDTWTLCYEGTTPQKLKTTTLTLQIFLVGNTTKTPNTTVAVKLTVK